MALQQIWAWWTCSPAKRNVSTQAGAIGDYTFRVLTTTREEWESEVIQLTICEGQKEGLTILSRNTLLERAAESHVLDMDASNRYLAHTGSNGSTPVDRIKATGYKGTWAPMDGGRFRTISSENANAGQLSPLEVVLGWMNNEGHRTAILAPPPQKTSTSVSNTSTRPAAPIGYRISAIPGPGA
jgi:uncharacterized protein YkwD